MSRGGGRGGNGGPRSTGHPEPEELARFARGRAGARDAAVRRHLEAGCLTCALRLRELWAGEIGTLRRLAWRGLADGGGEGASSSASSSELAARARAHTVLLRSERAAAPPLAVELLALPPVERTPAVRSGRRFRLLGLAEHLAARAREEVFDDPGHALVLARLAVEVAEALDDPGYEPPFVEDIRAAAWGALANAHRVAAELREAERAFRTAFARLAGGNRRLRPEHDLWSLLASLRIDQARFAEAVKILRRTAAAYRAAGDERLEGKTLVQLAKAAGEAGRPEEAVELLEAAEGVLDVEADRQLRLSSLHARVVWLLDAGRPAAAVDLFAEVRPLLERGLRGFESRQRLMWLRGRIAAVQGRFGAAERTLERVRRGLEERNEEYFAALVTLDLAQLYLEQGRMDDVRRLAGEMIRVFSSRRIHHHALSALAMFQGAAVTETATAELVAEVSTYLRRARNNPYLPFRSTT